MRRLLSGIVVCSLAASSAWAAAHMRFWNLTGETIVSLTLAPAGTGDWSPNQCDNDHDKSVEHDERLDLKGIAPGKYDVRFTLKSGKRCLARGIEVAGDRAYAFSLEPRDMKDCR